MPLPYPPNVITANALINGDVVYQTRDDQWSETLAHAEIITDEANAQIRLLDAQSQPEKVIGAYLAPIKTTPDGPVILHFREYFRATGPSNYSHGKQEARHV